MMKSKIFVALDVDTEVQALEIVGDLHGLNACFKVGKQLFTSAGPDLVRKIVGMGEDVFLDLKYHDIPNTVAKAGLAAASLGVIKPAGVKLQVSLIGVASLIFFLPNRKEKTKKNAFLPLS